MKRKELEEEKIEEEYSVGV